MCALLVSDVHRDLVVEPWRCAQARRAVIGPVDTALSLLGSALRRGDHTVTAEPLHLVESGCIFRALQGGWRWNPELVARLEDERCDPTPVSAQRESELADGVLAPLPG